MSITVEDLDRFNVEDRAFSAYFRRFGRNADQPASGLTVARKGKNAIVVALTNVRGTLAEYRVTKKGDDVRLQYVG
jgi:hypothetical protein